MKILKPSAKLEMLSADKPLVDPGRDRFGYATFAKHIADSLLRMTPAEGLTIAIYGPWGSGKSTLLNFVEHYIKGAKTTLGPVIMRFNPWWFSGQEDLTRRFFDQLQMALGNKRVFGINLRKQIADFADLVSEAPLPYAAGGKAVSKMVRPREVDVTKLRQNIENELTKNSRRIIVIIDDIDRLSSEEIRQLFKVVKAVADFANITYLLAFDKDVAIAALEKVQDSKGEEYLEKIIQVPFELPPPEKESLRNLFFEELNWVMEGTPEGLFDHIHWANVFWEGLDCYFNTPRDVTRLINSMRVTYPAVKGEVNFVDYVAIETLRVFSPKIYDLIRHNPDRFAGVNSEGLSNQNLEGLKSFHDLWLDRTPPSEKDSLKKLLLRLFPRLHSVWANSHYGHDWLSAWRKKAQICSPEILPVYFHLAVPEGDISLEEMRSIIALLSNPKAFAAKLLELVKQKRLDGRSRLRGFLERFEDYLDKDISEENIGPIINSLFDVGDKLYCPEDKPIGIAGFGNDLLIFRIIHALIRRVGQKDRFDILKEAISSGQAISTMTYVLGLLGREHGRFGADKADPEDQWTLSENDQLKLERMSLSKIRKAARDGVLVYVPKLSQVLYCWKDLATEREIRSWARKIIKNDKGLVVFVESFLSEGYVHTIGDAGGRPFFRLDPAWLEPYLDPKTIMKRLNLLSGEAELFGRQKVAIDQLIREYDMRKKGINPESVRSLLDQE